MTQSSNSINGTQTGAGISTILTNSRPSPGGGSFEAEVLSALQNSLVKLDGMQNGFDIEIKTLPVGGENPNSGASWLFSVTPRAVKSDPAPSATGQAKAVVSTGSTIASFPTSSGRFAGAGAAFQSAFNPTYEKPTSQVVDGNGTVVGQVSLNPYHFATQQTAEQLAAALGAKVVIAEVSGGPVQRNVVERELQFDGVQDTLNAGLVARAYELATERGEPIEAVNARLQAEIDYARRTALQFRQNA